MLCCVWKVWFVRVVLGRCLLCDAEQVVVLVVVGESHVQMLWGRCELENWIVLNVLTIISTL